MDDRTKAQREAAAWKEVSRMRREEGARRWQIRLGDGKVHLQAGRLRCLIVNQAGPATYLNIRQARAAMPELALIEAAPELLAALEGAISTLQAWKDGHGSRQLRESKAVQDQIDGWAAAIAKAKGEDR